MKNSLYNRRNLLCCVLFSILYNLQSSSAQEGDSFPRVPYRVGEKLSYSVNWTIGNIGSAYMEVTGIDSTSEHPCYRIEAAARSNKTIDIFYPVRDYFISLIDRKKLFSRKFTKHQKEGRHERYLEYIFDHQAGKRYDLANGDTVDIVPEVQDELSILYYFRSLEIEVGRGLLLENYVDKRGNPLKVAILRTEWIEVPAGRFFCYVVEPYLTGGSLFKHKGTLLIWIAKNESRIPVKVTGELEFGRIVVLLESFSLGAG